MTDADTYFEAEVAAFSQARADALSKKRLKEKADAAARAKRWHRDRHTVTIDDAYGEDEVHVCLLDVRVEALHHALEALDEDGDATVMDKDAMRSMRLLYLADRKADAADAIYPAIRDALGTAL